VYRSNVRYGKKKESDLHDLDTINLYKTAFLIRSAVRVSYFSSRYFSKSILKILDRFSIYIGLAFQIKDDIEDSNNNIVSLINNLKISKKQVDELYKKAFLALNDLKNKDLDVTFLEKLIQFIIKDIK